MPYIRDHFSRSSKKDTTLRTRSVHLIWTAKEEAFINRIFATELGRLTSGSGMFAAECFATAGPAQGPESSSSSLNTDSQDRLVKINTGRPDIPALIRQNIVNTAAADPCPGRTAVFVSGPASLADVTRAAVHIVLKETSYDVEYFEEVFGW